MTGYPPHPGPQAPPLQSARPGPALTIGGAVAAAAGLLIMLGIGHNYGLCQSFLGQLGQAGSPQVRQQCATASGAHWIGLLVIIGGAIMMVIGVVKLIAHQQGQPAPSQRAACMRCGLPPEAHLNGWCPPCCRCGRPALEHREGRCPSTT
jgi:hypothetical protein